MLLNGLSFVAFFPLLLSATLFLLFVTHALFFYCLTWAEQNEGHELWPKFGVSAGRVGGGGGRGGGGVGVWGFPIWGKGVVHYWVWRWCEVGSEKELQSLEVRGWRYWAAVVRIVWPEMWCNSSGNGRSS